MTRLNKLQEVDLDGWSSSMLPSLAQCTQLSSLHGEWVKPPAAGTRRRSSGNAPIIECPSVLTLGALGDWPVASFKQARHITQWETWQPAVFKSIAQHCQQLTALKFECLEDRERTASMPAEAPAAQRVAAIRSLAGLQQLRLLEVTVNDSREVAALAAATQLRTLGLLVPVGSSCSMTGLMHLVALRRLQQLVLDPRRLDVTAEEAESLIVALQFVPSVVVVCFMSC
jgi:hypothetical protein